jgi:hypothetical protein
MQRYQIKYWLTLTLDYKVVNIIHLVIITTLWSWNFNNWTQRSSHHPSLRVPWRFRSYPSWKGNNLITWHTWATKAPWEATVHDYYQRVEPGPPHPSASLPHDTSMGIHGWPPTPSQYTSIKHGGVLSNSVTVRANKFLGSHKSCMRQYIINACSMRPNWCGT